MSPHPEGLDSGLGQLQFGLLKVFVGLPALLFGAALGVPIYQECVAGASLVEAFKSLIGSELWLDILGWFVCGTLLVFLLRLERWGLRRGLTRIVWFSAFAFGALGGLLMIWWIQR